MIDKFTIYGERCSGTNFLRETFIKNFDLQYLNKSFHDDVVKDDNRHFFCKENPFYKDDTVLHIGIIRHPVEWMDSFFSTPWHVSENNKKSIYHFLFHEFYSVYDGSFENTTTEVYPHYMNKEIVEDRNYITGNRYKNIFELRKCKNDYLIHTIPQHVKNYVLVVYEDLRDHYEETLLRIQQQFNLHMKSSYILPNSQYKQLKNTTFVKKNIKHLTKDLIETIYEFVDKEQEEKLGYNMKKFENEKV